MKSRTNFLHVVALPAIALTVTFLSSCAANSGGDNRTYNPETQNYERTNGPAAVDARRTGVNAPER